MRIRPTFAALAIAPLLLALTPPMAMGAGRTPSPVVNTIRNGTGAPKSSLGIDGDFYIDTRSLVLYGPKKKGKWPAPRNLQGPVGATGSAGSDGKSGSDGRTITSASTTSGPQGIPGPQGIAGAQGLPGVKGEAGANGSPGSAGPQGAPGSSGPQGAQGVPGIQGIAGITEVTVIDIPQWILSSATPFSFTNSQNFGLFQAGKSYVLRIYVSGTSINGNMALGVDLISSGAGINFSYSRSYALYANYTSSRWIYSFEITATLVVGTANTSMSVRVIDGLGDSGASPLTLTGKAYITSVGLVR